MGQDLARACIRGRLQPSEVDPAGAARLDCWLLAVGLLNVLLSEIPFPEQLMYPGSRFMKRVLLRAIGGGAHFEDQGVHMGPYSLDRCGDSTRGFTSFLKLSLVMMVGLIGCAAAAAQDIKLGVTYVCNGEHIWVDSCNVRDLSDTATCMVEHPDHVNAGGIAAITSEARGSLKQKLATCTQPTAKELAAHDVFVKKQQEVYAANVAKANPPAPTVVNRPQGGGGPVQVTPPKNAEERQMRRCVSSGRLPASCTGNQLLGAFSSMIGQVADQVAPGMIKDTTKAIGPEMSGVFQGAGGWRIDFIDGGVLVNCAGLSPNQQYYTLDFRNGHAVITVDTTPKPLVLTLNADETAMTAPGPVVIDGVVASGTSTSGPDPNGRSGYTDKNGISLTNSQAASSSEVYQGASRHYGPVTPSGTTYTNFAHKRVTCPALNLSSKGAGVGMQTMQTDLLKSAFSDGEKGPPTPSGIRMRGIYAASTGFSLEFFPESVILGCGPDSARAYPYAVAADGAKGVVKIAAPDHPLTLTLAGGSLDPGSTEPYLVHGRIVTGQNDKGDFTFAPLEQTCNLSALSPSKTIPSGGGVAAPMMASAGAAGGGAGRAPGAGTAGAAPDNNGGRLSTPAAPLGNAALSLASGIPAQPGAPNPLAGRPYVLLRDSYGNALAKGGVTVPAGMSPYKYVASTCAPGRTPDCQKALAAINTDAASAVRADANGSGTFPGVPPGTYYLMISVVYNNQPITWGQAVQLKAGPNALKLDPKDATPIQ
jgi:hypothetical protein